MEPRLQSLAERFVDDPEGLNEEELGFLLRHLRENPALAAELGDELISDQLLSSALHPYRQNFPEQVIQRIEDRESRTDFNSRVLSALKESPAEAAALRRAALHDEPAKPGNGNRLRAVREPGLWAYRKRQKRFRILSLSLAACALMIACFLVYDAHFRRTSDGQFVAEIVGAESGIFIEHDGEGIPCAAGRGLCEGDVIRVGEGQHASFSYTGYDARVDLGEKTGLEIGSVAGEKRLCLLYGRMEMAVMPQPAGQRFIIETPHAVAMIKGTMLALQIERDFTRLDVTEGVVAFRSRDEDAFTDVPAGRYAVGRIGHRLVLGVIGVQPEPERPPVPGLAAHWTFDAGTGISVPDASGNGNSGTIHGASEGAGRLDGGLHITGECSMKVKDHPSLNPVSEISICFRMKAPAGTNYGMMVSKSYNHQYAVMWYAGTRRIRFDLWPWFSYAAPYGQFFGDIQLSSDEWHHVACTFDGHRARIYVDGAPDRESPEVSGALTVTSHPLCVGMNPDGNYRFSGALDEIRIYDRALSPEEIEELARPSARDDGDEKQ